jgi:hypothetical protein
MTTAPLSNMTADTQKKTLKRGRRENTKQKVQSTNAERSPSKTRTSRLRISPPSVLFKPNCVFERPSGSAQKPVASGQLPPAPTTPKRGGSSINTSKRKRSTSGSNKRPTASRWISERQWVGVDPKYAGGTPSVLVTPDDVLCK